MTMENKSLKIVPFLKINGKYIYVNAETMEAITTKEYDDASCFTNINSQEICDLAQVELNGKMGMIDKTGSEIVEVIYDEITYTEVSAIRLKLNKKLGIANAKGELQIPILFDELGDLKQNLIVSKLDGKYGIFKIGYGELVPNKHTNISIIEVKDNFIILEVNNKFGILNKKNKLLLFNKIIKINYDFLIIKNKEKYGLITSEGDEITVDIYDELKCYSEYVVIGKINNLYEFIDYKTGLQISNSKYQYIDSICEGRSVCTYLNFKKVFVDERGIQISEEYDKLGNYCEGLAWYQIGNEFGYLDLKGQKVFIIKADMLECFYNGEAKYYVNKKVGLINKLGEIILEACYDIIDTPFTNGYRTYVKDGKAGIIDNKYNVIKEFKHTRVSFLDNSLLKSEFDGYFGLLTISGGDLCEPIYDSLRLYNSDLIIVNKEKGVGLLNKTGKCIIKPIYEKIEFIENHNDSNNFFYLEVTLKKKKGILDLEGNILVPIEFDTIDKNINYLQLCSNRKVQIYSLIEKKFFDLELTSVNDSKTSINFESNFISVKKDGGLVIINNNGYIISTNNYDSIGNHSSSLSFLHSFKKGNKSGFLRINNESVEETIPAKYDTIISEFGKWNRYKRVNYDASDFARVKLGDQSFYISEFGKEYREL